MPRRARRALSAALAAGSVALAACGAEESANESPPHDLAGGGEVRQGGEVLGEVDEMADCRYERERLERCAERRSYPRTTIAGLRDLGSHDLAVTVPTAWRVEVRALHDDDVLAGWQDGAQLIDYGAIRGWSLYPPVDREDSGKRTPPARADALRIVAYGDDARARGFELTIP
ncbi:MAG TPA: hypothetical protein VIL49_00620 [Capillimicrobium sp.]